MEAVVKETEPAVNITARTPDEALTVTPEPAADGKVYLSVKAAAVIAGVSEAALYNAISGDRLRCEKTPGGVRRIWRDDLDDYLKRYPPLAGRERTEAARKASLASRHKPAEPKPAPVPPKPEPTLPELLDRYTEATRLYLDSHAKHVEAVNQEHILAVQTEMRQQAMDSARAALDKALAGLAS